MTESYLFRLSSLGDIVLCSALAKSLAQDPRRRLHFVTGENFGRFVGRSFPASLDVRTLKTRGLFHFLIDGFNEASRFKGDPTEIEIFDLHNVIKSKFWSWAFCLRAWQLGSQVTVRRTSKKGFRRLLSVLLGRDLIGPRFIYNEHLKLNRNPGSGQGTFKPELLATRTRMPTKTLLLAPEAQHWKKIWPANYWEELVKSVLEKSDWNLTLVGGSKALPLDIIDELTAVAGPRLKNLLGKTSLEELPTLAAAHDFTLCGNSAWQHISEAVGTPVVSLAGPIVPGFGFAPWRPESRELSVPLPCRPCTRHGGGPCRLRGAAFHACMRHLKPKFVFETLLKMAGS